MEVRPADPADLETIVACSRDARHRRAEWAPVYFRPGVSADELHPLFLEFMIGSQDHETRAIVDDGAVVGFFVRIEQTRRVWLDDLVVVDDARWPAVFDLILRAQTEPWVTCVSPSDTAQLAAMAEAGIGRKSSYFARSVTPGSKASHETQVDSIKDDPERAALHTFGPGPFSSTTDGALVIADDSDGYLVGSPSVTPPPIYDPGGPTTVVDRVVGTDRRALVESACSVVAGRGDAQLVVVCDVHDAELEQTLLDLDFTPVVDLMGHPHG